MCVCVCRSWCDRSGMSECTRVCVVVCDSLCVFGCVFRGIPLQGRRRGAWPSGQDSNSGTRPPVHPLIQPAVEGFPLQTKWKIPRQKVPPSDFFVWVFNLSSFLLPPTYSPRRFCLWLFCFYPQFFFVGAHAETLLNQMKAGMCGLRCQNRNFLPAREASVCWFYKEVRFIGEWSDAEAGGGAAFTPSYGSINKNKEAYNGSFTARCLEQK